MTATSYPVIVLPCHPGRTHQPLTLRPRILAGHEPLRTAPLVAPAYRPPGLPGSHVLQGLLVDSEVVGKKGRSLLASRPGSRRELDSSEYVRGPRKGVAEMYIR